MATAALLTLAAAAFAPGAQARVETFQSLAPSSAPLTALTSDPGTGLIYAQEEGGTGFFRYDPRSNAWTELPPAPLSSNNNGGATYLNGKIYIVYTGNSSNLSVYDIGSNSWDTIENPLEEGSADITAANGKLYLAVEERFFSLDPATGTATPLAEPPKFEAAGCTDGFERWGGLVADGGKIYGHQGNGCTGFGVYDIASDSWQELPLVPAVSEEGGEPEGAVLGSAINPVTNTYLTAGPYPGKTLWRFDIEAGSWSTGTLPFEVEDNGMTYVSLPGFEGVYIIQGEHGTEFTRYTERNQADLSPSLSAAVKKGGNITYSIQVRNDGPERASGVVLSDVLPGKATLVSATTSQGACAGTTAITCDLGVLRAGAAASLTIQVKASLRNVTNTATVSSQAADVNTGNDSASLVTKQCVVPKVKKRGVKAAKKALRKANCKPGKIVRRFSGKVKEGKIVRSGKNRGKVVPAGSKVKLVVSRGPKNA